MLNIPATIDKREPNMERLLQALHTIPLSEMMLFRDNAHVPALSPCETRLRKP